jgi:hypothetical protein
MNAPSDESDPAAVFGCALSLWNACNDAARADPQLNLSEAYQGMDQLMREVMLIGGRFEAWACTHVAFEELGEVWPYMLEEKFGVACLEILIPSALAGFDDDDCFRLALRLDLPVRATTGLPVSVDITAANPVPGSDFVAFRIRTVKDDLEDHICQPFRESDDPFDGQFGAPYFGLYGVGNDGLEEHVADRSSYAEVLRLCRRLSPGIDLPECAVRARRQS